MSANKPLTTRVTDLKIHSLAQLHSHVAQPTQTNNTQLSARLVQTIVLDGAVGGDASTQEGSCSIQGQVLWQMQQEAAEQNKANVRSMNKYCCQP